LVTTNKLRFSFKFAYGVGQAGEGIFGTGLGFFLLFYYSQILELSPGLAGTAIGIAVIVDAFSDMIAGSVSDHWRSRLGRRHPFMYASFIPLSCVFFLLFFLFRKKYVLSFFFFGLAIFSHLQILILCLGRALQLFINEVKPLLFKLQFKRSLLFVLPMIVFVFFAINSTQISGLPYLFFKITAYGGDRSIFDFLRMTIFLLIALYYTKDRLETLIYFLPLFIALYFVGEDRMNMIGYIFCLYYCLPYRAGLNLGVLITSLYFLYANIDFISKIILYGNGFPPQP